MGRDLAIDANGDVFVTGFYEGTVDFGGGPVSATGSGNATAEAFVAAFGNSGAYQWHESFGGVGDEGGSAIALDAAGNVIFGGFFASPSVDFGTGAPLTPPGTSGDAFIVALGRHP